MAIRLSDRVKAQISRHRNARTSGTARWLPWLSDVAHGPCGGLSSNAATPMATRWKSTRKSFCDRAARRRPPQKPSPCLALQAPRRRVPPRQTRDHDRARLNAASAPATANAP